MVDPFPLTPSPLSSRNGKPKSNNMDTDTETQVAPTPNETERKTEWINEEWNNNPNNPWNWPAGKKGIQLAMLSLNALLASIATSIISPARSVVMQKFDVSGTVALLPLTLYVVALGFGPVVGGPVSETWGRYPVYLVTLPVGALFTLGAGLTDSFAGLCVVRFLAGFCWAPMLATAAGSITDTFPPATRGPASAIFIMMPFLGPGLGPIIGAFVVVEQGWRWTQWTLLFLAALCMAITLCSEETFGPVIQRRLARKNGTAPSADAQPEDAKSRLRNFLVVGLFRPVHMLFCEPIVAFTCLYVAAEFGTLFAFFAAVPYTFTRVYGFTVQECGLVFLSIVVGCMLGLIVIMLCDVLLYRGRAARKHGGVDRVPPEHRLYPAMVASVGLPVGLFWYAWSAREGVSWASPAVAMVPFALGNFCLFVSTMQYNADVYHGNVVASAASANSLARYVFAGVFPLFTVQMYEKLGIDWATSLLGFIALALMPVPWVFFKYGPQLRRRSKYETTPYY